MTIPLSILIPHKKTPQNDKALAIALACIADNTHNSYQLLVDSETPADPYVVINRLAEMARGEYLFLSNSDIFVSPGWDVDLLERASPYKIVNATLVEPGAIGVFDGNITRNFGMLPSTFRRADFEEWVTTNPTLPAGNGFVYYAVIHRQSFLKRGGFDISRGNFPTPLDSFFWEAWKREGLEIARSTSLVYHLQNYSNPEEQEKPARQA